MLSSKPAMSPPEAILFDFDGVIIDSLPVMQMAFRAALKQTYPGHEWNPDELFSRYRQHLGKSFKVIVSELGLSEALYQPFRTHSRYLAPYVDLYPQILAVLRYCRQQGLPLGLATGKDSERTEELLQQCAIREFFSEVICSDQVTQPKPAPEMAQLFCQRQKLEPQQVLMVGDAEADIACGRDAGCATALALWGYTEAEAAQAWQPDLVLNQPSDLLQLVNGERQ